MYKLHKNIGKILCKMLDPEKNRALRSPAHGKEKERLRTLSLLALSSVNATYSTDVADSIPLRGRDVAH